MELDQLNGDRQQEEQRILDEIKKKIDIFIGVQRRYLPGGRWRRLASRRDWHLRHADCRALLPADADLCL